MKYVSLIVLVLAAGCQTVGPEAKRVIKINGVGWSDPTTYALVPMDADNNPENELLVQKLDEALQSRGFRPVDASRAEQIIHVQYSAQAGSTDEDRLAGVTAGAEGVLPDANAAEPAETNAGRFYISLKACDGPTLRITGTRIIVMWSLTVEVTNVSDASEAIPILAGMARKYLAKETSGPIKVTERIRAAGQPATAKNETAG
jgi:hypothetical protein